MTLQDENLLSLWLAADRIPKETVRQLIEELDELRELLPEDDQYGWPRYDIPR
jgi:hypothetical protein